MTYEPMHAAQAQSVRVTKQCFLVLLVTIVATAKFHTSSLSQYNDVFMLAVEHD